MSECEAEFPKREAGQNQRGVILGYWDHEKTPTLIQDLEHSVSAVEKKCKNLLEELIYYKKYLEESEEPEVAVLKKKNKKSENSNLFFGSDPDIAFRKTLINLQENQQIFEEKFQEKLVNINKELRAAAQKLGLKDSIILFPMDEYLRNLTAQTEHKARNTWNDVRDKFIELNQFKAKTRSDSVIADFSGREQQYAKITRNELELYQKLSRLTLKKSARVRPKVGKLISKGRKITFRCRKKSPAFCQDPNIQGSAQKTPKRRRKTASVVPKRPRTSPQCLCPPGTSPPAQDSLEMPTGCKSVAGALRNANEKLPMGVVVRQCVPFTACTSTSRSYNIGLNMQQLLSLSRRMRSLRVSQGRQEGRSGSWKGKDCGEAEKRGSVSWIPGAKSDGFESEELSRLEQDGKVWVSKRRTSSDFRKVRSRYTGSSSGGVVEYHKSTMSRYTNGQKSMIKSESKSAYAVGSKIMVSGCERTDVFEIDKDEGLAGQASGDGSCNEKCTRLSMEWTKVYGSFLSTYRKYTSLKEKLSDSEAVPSNDELKSLETEIDNAIEKYKDFLQFYSKFLHLKHRLKSLKIACETKTFEPATAFSSNCGKKAYACRTTYSMAMKKALKEIQALQDKISLISD